MKILHIVPGTCDVANGMAVVARLLVKEQGDAEAVDLDHGMPRIHESDVGEVWVHGMWLPKEWLACRRVFRAGKKLVRMTHGGLSPVYLKCQSPCKKWFVGPVERWCLRRCAKIVATCEAEKDWITRYLGRRCPPIEVTDIRRFFDLKRVERVEGGVLTQSRSGAECAEHDRDLSASLRLCVENKKQRDPIHLLYLGRRHPLKGLEYLEAAVAELNSNPVNPVNPVQKTSVRPALALRVVSNAFGEELERIWNW